MSKKYETHDGKNAKQRCDSKMIRPVFGLNPEQSRKAREKYGDNTAINARAKELFLADMEDLSDLEKTENQDIKTALDYVERLNADEKFKRQLEVREDTLRNENSALNWAERKGKKEGREEEREQMIQAMKANGMSDAEIQKIVQSIQ